MESSMNDKMGTGLERGGEKRKALENVLPRVCPAVKGSGRLALLGQKQR